MSAPQQANHVVVQADGGSRGNPGPAGYGAVVFDDQGAVLAERAASISVSPPRSLPSATALLRWTNSVSRLASAETLSLRAASSALIATCAATQLSLDTDAPAALFTALSALA